MSDEHTQCLAQFLRDTADKVDNGAITETQSQLLYEFQRTYLFSGLLEQQEFDEKNLLKFLVLGWYIYTMSSTIRVRDDDIPIDQCD